jgi:hypothetical protein
VAEIDAKIEFGGGRAPEGFEAAVPISA